MVAIAVAVYFYKDTGEKIVHEAVTISGPFDKCRSRNQMNCVVDGDTFRYGSLIIRIEDIDTPETVKSRCATEAALGAVATQRMIALLNQGPFELVNDGGRDEDRYGRKLRTVERDGRSLGLILISEGLAHRWDGGKKSWCP